MAWNVCSLLLISEGTIFKRLHIIPGIVVLTHARKPSILRKILRIEIQN